MQQTEISLEGWDISSAAMSSDAGPDGGWVPWGGPAGNARAKLLAAADGFNLALIEAGPGYRGDPHVHEHPELLYVVDGSLRNQGVPMVAGDGYAAAPGSTHTDFETDTGATYLLVFKL